MGRLIQIAASTLLSGGILNHGSLGGYISNATRLALGMGLAELQDGQVHYFSRHHDLLKRAAIQVASQTAYGLLRSYPRYLKYWEQQVRDKYLQTQSQSSLANKTGQYYQLIREQQAVAQKKNHIDSIVGRTVADFLELSISEEGKYYDNSECKVLPNSRYGLVTFVDLGPQVQVSSRNNILLTRVQGRDYTRKEYISGGDLEITIGSVQVYQAGTIQGCHRLRQHGIAPVQHFTVDYTGLYLTAYGLPERAAVFAELCRRGAIGSRGTETGGTGKGGHGHQAHEQVDQVC